MNDLPIAVSFVGFLMCNVAISLHVYVSFNQRGFVYDNYTCLFGYRNNSLVAC